MQARVEVEAERMREAVLAARAQATASRDVRDMWGVLWAMRAGRRAVERAKHAIGWVQAPQEMRQAVDLLNDTVLALRVLGTGLESDGSGMR